MTRTKLDGTTTAITGAGSGIGRATALLAAEKGARLALTDESADTLAETVRLVGEAGCGRYLVFTSQDIRLLHWAQRYVPFVYTVIMRVMNQQARRLLKGRFSPPAGR